MEFKEVKILVNTALESDDPKEVRAIMKKLEEGPVTSPGAVEAILSGISVKMSQLLSNGETA